MPLVHVLIPALNCGSYVADAVNSIVGQTFRDFVVTVIDDGSTDGTGRVLASIHDSRLRVVTNERTLGLPSSLNAHFDDVDCEYIARMDADDVAYPARFEAQLSFLREHTDIDILGTSAFRLSHGGRKKRPFSTYAFAEHHDEIKGNLLFGSPMLHPSVMLRRRSLRDLCPIYRPIAVPAADYDAWLTLAMRGLKFANLAAPLMDYRVHDSQISAARASAQKLVGDALRIRALRQVVPEISQPHWEAHDAIRTNDWRRLNISDTLSWFRFLLNSNRTSRWTSHSALSAILERRLRTAIEKSTMFPRLARLRFARRAAAIFR